MSIFGHVDKLQTSILPMMAVLIPIAGALFIQAFGKRLGKTRDWVVVATTGITFAIVLSMYPLFLGKSATFGLKYSLPKSIMGVGLNFGADSLSLLVAIVTSFVWFAATVYAMGYMDHDPKPNRFYFFLLLVLGSNLGVVLTTDLFSLFVFFEGLGFLSYPLIIHEETADAVKAGTKYMIITAIGGLSLLMGIFLIYNYSGSFAITSAAKTLSGLGSIKIWIAVFMIAGFGVKAGMIPLHIWLPDAHPVAPSPASALLSGIMIKAGAYGIIRTIYVLYGVNLVKTSGISQVMLVIAIITMLMGSLVALKQTEIKRLLAYSSIAQMGYILLGVALLTERSVTGASLHIFNHAMMKGTLFFSAGAIMHQTGLRNLDDLHLIGKRMPMVMVAVTIAGASMIGIPPTAGFLSKWFLATGAMQAVEVGNISYNIGILIIVALLTSSILNLLYYGSIILKGWIGTPMPQIAGASHSADPDAGDPSWKMLAPTLTLASGIIIFGIFPQFPISMAQKIATLLVVVK